MYVVRVFHTADMKMFTEELNTTMRVEGNKPE
jgi:hypothetical protein